MCLAVVGRIRSTTGEDVARSAVVEIGGEERIVTLSFVPEARIGDWVTVHSGHAIAVTSERDALATIALSHEIGG